MSNLNEPNLSPSILPLRLLAPPPPAIELAPIQRPHPNLPWADAHGYGDDGHL